MYSVCTVYKYVKCTLKILERLFFCHRIFNFLHILSQTFYHFGMNEICVIPYLQLTQFCDRNIKLTFSLFL